MNRSATSVAPDADASRKKSDLYPSLSKLPTSGNGRRTYPAEFEEFWTVYPKRTDKAEGYSAWRSAIKRGVSADKIRDAAQAYAQQCADRQTTPQHIKNAQGWINGDRFNNEYTPDPKAEHDGMTDVDRAYYALLEEQQQTTDDYIDAEVVDTTFTQEIAS